MDSRVGEILETSRYAVFFGGAGVSTESGIPDFRSKDGLYNQKFSVSPEEMLSHTYFVNHTAEFFRFYKEKMNCLRAKPNPAHLSLAEWERRGVIKAVITQNIDGLHQMAGSRCVLELHGSVRRNYCYRCRKFYDADVIFSADGVPTCTCGDVIKPDVVLYEEALDTNTVKEAIRHIESADTLIVAGTSLTVYPAAGYVQYFRGENLILINRDPTPLDGQATLCIREPVGEVLGM
ncbi:MAG: NAD-dependent protein deacylase [Ruminococcaceae bacterium]|nr:NAD-dependent protein deacylase [Oscillospiraceae bacterium]